MFGIVGEPLFVEDEEDKSKRCQSSIGVQIVKFDIPSPPSDQLYSFMNICVYPSGAWGTALAVQLDRAGHRVTLITRDLDEALEMTTRREHKRRLPGVALPPGFQISTELKPALMEAEVAILASPSKYLRDTCRELKAAATLATNLRWVLALCKGLEIGSNRLPLAVMEDELGDYHLGVLSGPTFASEVARGQPSAIVLGAMAPTPDVQRLQAALSDRTFRVYTSDDPTGVQLGGCLKNVYAIAAGMGQGLGLGHNSAAALVTRALRELVRVGGALGGKPETFFGLSGLGDLMLTCHGEESRNRRFGKLLAEGKTVETLLHDEGMTVEGYRTAACFHAICEAKGIPAPILEQVYRILFEGQDLPSALSALMERDLKDEAV